MKILGAIPRLHRRSNGEVRLSRATVSLLLLAVCLCVGTPALQPPVVRADTYDAYACTQPDGAAAPADGWAPFSNNAEMVAENTCSQANGYLTAGMLGYAEVPVGAEAGGTFSPPSGTTIKEATINWYYNNSDNQDTGYATAFESLEAPYRGSQPFATCVHSAPCCCSGYHGHVSPENAVKVPEQALQPEKRSPAASITMIAGCTATVPDAGDHCDGGSLQFAAVALMSMATVMLEDDSPPRVSVVGGSLTTGSELEGAQTLAITASDTGSGIYQAVLEVDGKQVQATTIDNNNGHCENVGQTSDGRPAFLYVVPCKLEINDQYVTFSLAGILDGPHKLTVLVTDAAGNKTTAFTREVIVGRGACNGTCVDQAQLVVSNPKLLRPVTCRYARSAIKLSGVLREPTGAPVPGATLELLQQATYIGAPTVPIATTMTNATGQWTFDVRRGPSRVLVVAWRSHALDTGYASQIAYHERVFADIGLAAPRRVRAGVPFTFRGKLVGGYVPREGDIVQMEIFYLGRWRTIETVRSSRTGTFTYGYTFSETGKGSYLFRASIRKNSTYPYLPTTSHPIRIKTH